MTFFLRFYLFIFRQRRREIERERNIHVWLPLTRPPTGDLACNPGMCPDQESNQRPFRSQARLNPLSHASQDLMRDLHVTKTPSLMKLRVWPTGTSSGKGRGTACHPQQTGRTWALKVRAIWAGVGKGGASWVVNVVKEILKRQKLGRTHRLRNWGDYRDQGCRDRGLGRGHWEYEATQGSGTD